jgi:hypothetical protein
MQHKSQPSLWINARLLQPISICVREFAISNIYSGIIDFNGLIEPAYK